MKKALFCAVLYATAGLSGTPAASAVVSGNWDIVNNTGQDANDLHLTIRNARAVDFKESFNGPFGNPTVDDETIVSPVVGVDWSGATVGAGEKIHVGVEFDKLFNSMRVVEAYWTEDKNPIGAIDSAALGFESGGLLANAFFELENSGTEQVTVRDLQFQIVADVLPLSDMLPYQFGGWGPSIPDFNLLPGEAVSFFPGLLPGGASLLAQMDVVQTSDPTDRTQMMFQHEAVPLPGAAVFAMSALAALAGLSRLRTRTARSNLYQA